MKKVRLDKIQGNSEVKKYLEKRIENGSFSHAVVITGKSGFGKKTLTNDIISAMACESENAPCGTCDRCKKISDNECVDIYIIKKPENRTTIPIDAIRDIYSSISYKPNDLDFKVYILEDGDKIPPRTQNALLKLLEEPPQGVYFFILCEDEKKLLPTIRSRCEVFNLNPFTHNELTELLKDMGFTENLDDIVSLSDGSLGTAVRIASGDNGILARRAVTDKMIELLLDRTGSEFGFISYQLENIKSSQDYFEVCRAVLSALRDIITVKEDAECALSYFYDTEKAEEYAQIYPCTTLLSMCDIFFDALQNENVNTRLSLMLTEYSSRLWKTKYNGDNKCQR